MPGLMPSLLKYFTIIGGILFAGLIGLNAVMDPGGPGPRLVTETKLPRPRLDPAATKVERLRTEEALRAAEKAYAQAPGNAPQPVAVAEPTQTPQTTAQPAAPAVMEAAPPPDTVSAPASLVPAVGESEHATRLAQEEMKQRQAAEKARKKRIARERARMRAVEEASAARQQDNYYYGYAPRPTYGRFGQAQGGWGGGWQGGGDWGQRW